ASGLPAAASPTRAGEKWAPALDRPARLMMILPVEAAMLSKMDRTRDDDAPGRLKAIKAICGAWSPY
ncbi:MAG TPA: hypothetical protein VHS97_22155, partial [Isosphaeraceae bacterium]|nr:hypothetical protein [Isosphaeraceae bacterium]